MEGGSIYKGIGFKSRGWETNQAAFIKKWQFMRA